MTPSDGKAIDRPIPVANHAALTHRGPTAPSLSPSSHPAKRRRLNNASSGLSKPFKSPLKAAVRSGEDGGGAVDASKDQQLENNPAAITDSRTHLHRPSTTTLASKPGPNPSSPDHPLKKESQFLTLQKQHSALLLQLTQLRQCFDTAQQALKIASSATDSELATLISKWKLASREAAEEVFRGAKDRVNRMGGVGAWRERSRKKPEGWDDDSEPALEELSEEQREQVQIQKEELEAERRKYGPDKAEETMVERDDDVSTHLTSQHRILDAVSCTSTDIWETSRSPWP